MKDRGPVERLYFEREDVDEIVRKISMTRHVERYCMIRQWCKGLVVDCASGCGYGTFLISENPDVDNVIGVDVSKEAIDWAELNFSNEKIKFENEPFQNIPNILNGIKPDVLVSIETIEHIKDTESYMNSIKKINAELVILSYPTKKSTHFNKFHHHDFSDNDISNMFNDAGYISTKNINLYNELSLILFHKR